MRSLDRFAQTKLDRLDAETLRRTPVATRRGSFPVVERGTKRLLSFSCNDYLGLSVRPEVIEASVEAARCFGAGAGASRLVTGNSDLYAALEARLAALKGAEAACVFGSGYLANIGVLGVFAGARDLVLIDELAHACLHAGARLSDAAVARFRHNDVAHVATLLAERRHAYRHVVLVTETVFSMDGDRAPLAALSDIAVENDAWLMSDDAHGLAVLSAKPSGVAAPLQMGTLSKALGSYGGYCCGSRPVVDLIKTRARSLVYTTALPPASLGAALAALAVMEAEPGLAAEPLRKARLFTLRLGLPEAASPIVPIVLGAAAAALEASAALEEAGFLVTAIRPPTVPPNSARLRFAFCALHSDSEIERLAATITASSWWRHAIHNGREVKRCPLSS